MKKGRSTFVVGLLHVRYSSEESTSYERGYIGGRVTVENVERRVRLVLECNFDEDIIIYK